MGSRIFVVDSSPAVRRMVEQISASQGFEVIGFQDGPTALEAAKRLSPDLIIADYHLEKMTFSGFCKELNQLDNLSDTPIVSVITLSDRPDENRLRSLGVKAFLKKPFQSDHLLEVIKSLHLDSKPTTADGTRSKPGQKTWPIESLTTHRDNFVELSEHPESKPVDEKCEGSVTKRPASPVASTTDSSAPLTFQTASQRQPASLVEEAMRDLLGHLVQSISERAERKAEELLTGILSRQIEAQVSRAVKDEIQNQFTVGVLAEQIAQVVRDGIADELPKAMTRQQSDLESMLSKRIQEAAVSAVQEVIEQVGAHLVESAVRKQLPGILGEQLAAMDHLVKQCIQEAVARHVGDAAEAVVREIAEQSIAMAVRQIVPHLAENHAKDQTKGLTAS